MAVGLDGRFTPTGRDACPTVGFVASVCGSMKVGVAMALPKRAGKEKCKDSDAAA